MKKVVLTMGVLILAAASACADPDTMTEPDLPEFVHIDGWYDEGQWIYEYHEEHGYWRCSYVRPDGLEMPFECGALLVGIQPGVADEELDDLWEQIGLHDTPTFRRDHPHRGAAGRVEMRHEPEALRIADADPRTRYTSLNWTGPATCGMVGGCGND